MFFIHDRAGVCRGTWDPVVPFPFFHNLPRLSPQTLYRILRNFEGETPGTMCHHEKQSDTTGVARGGGAARGEGGGGGGTARVPRGAIERPRAVPGVHGRRTTTPGKGGGGSGQVDSDKCLGQVFGGPLPQPGRAAAAAAASAAAAGLRRRRGCHSADALSLHHC